MDEYEARIGIFDILMRPYFTNNQYNQMFSYLKENGFFTAPASRKYHGNYEGGLFDHSHEVLKALENLTSKLGLEWQNKRSPYIIGMFHDLCKIDQYRHPGTGVYVDGNETVDTSKWEYNKNTYLDGHGDKSIILLSQFLALTEEEILCIRWHMGAFDEKENWNKYTKAIAKYPNVLYTHTADMIASHILNT